MWYPDSGQNARKRVTRLILELVVRLVHKYDLGEKNVHCLFTHSCVLQLLQFLLFAATIYLSKMIDPSKKHVD